MVTEQERRFARQKQINEQLAKYMSGEISQEEAAGKVKIIFRGGGTGSAADPEKAEAFRVAKEKATKAKAEAEAKAKAEAEAKRIAVEKARIAREKLAATRTQQALRKADKQRRIDQDISRIRTTSSGGVSVTSEGEGSSAQRTQTYYGDIIVPGTGGLTANQYKRKLEKEAREKFGTGRGEQIGFRSEEEVKIPKEVKKVEFEVTEEGYVKPTSVITGSKDIFFKDVDRTGQTYVPSEGYYIKGTYPSGAGGTGIITPPTPSERAKIEAAQYKGDLYGKAIVSVPAQYLGTVFDKQISEETAKKFEGKGFGGRVLTFLNPKTQWEIYKESEEKKKAVREANKIMSKIELLNKKYNDGKISYESYLARYNYLSTLPEVSEAQVPTMSFKEALGKSSLTETQKGYIGTAIGATQILPYFSPGGRVLLGTGQIIEGSEKLKYAETKGEKTMGKIQIGLGTIIAASGVKPFISPSVPSTQTTLLGMKVTGTTSQMNWLMGAKQAGIITVGSSLGTLGGVSTYKETGSLGLAIGTGVGTTAILTSPVWVKPIVSQFKKDVGGVKSWFKSEKEYGLLKRRPSTGGISKRGSTQLMARQESKYIYDYKTGKYVLKSEARQPTAIQVETKFKSLSTEEQTRTITRALEGRVFLDTKSKADFILKWTRFMKTSGLSNQQIQSVLLKSGLIQRLPIQQVSTVLVEKTKGGTVIQRETLQPSQVGETRWATSQGVFQDSLQSQDTKQIQWLGTDTKQVQAQRQIQLLKLDTRQAQKSKQAQRQIQLLGFATAQLTRQRTRQLTRQQSKQEQLLSMNLLSKQMTRQLPKQIQRPKLETRNIFEQEPRPKPPEEPPPGIPPPLSLPGRMLKKVREQPEIFEAFAFTFGKKKKLGVGTKEVVAKKLSKYLKKELSASGFITKGGEKIKAIETGLLSKPSFRKSKVSEFLVVERKAKRLRKAGTGKTIQYFRSKGKKSKGKNLFGL